MIEVMLWLTLCVVMYVAGRVDVISEIESNDYHLEWVTPFRIRLTRVSRDAGERWKE